MAQTLWKTLAYARGKFKRLVISTNGTKLNKNNSKQLSKYVTNCQVSIDGATEKTHDIMRGNGNFDRAIKGIKRLQDAGVKVGIRLTLHKGNMHEVLQYVELAANLGLADAYLRRVIPSGNAKKHNMQSLSPDELRITIGNAIEHGKSLGLHVASADYFCQIYFREESRIKAIATQKANGNRIGGCAIGINSFYVMQNGIIAYCPYLPVFCGDLRTQTLEDIWQNSPMMKVARSLRHNLKGKCALCQYKFACGGCRAYAYAVSGDILAEDSGCWL